MLVGKHQGNYSRTAKAARIMRSKSIVHLLLLFSLFVSCLPAPKLLLVETEGGEEADEDGGAGEYVGADYNRGGLNLPNQLGITFSDVFRWFLL